MTIRAYDQKNPVVSKTAWVDPSAVIVGDVILDDHVSIWPQVVIRGDVNSITVGAGTNVQDGAVLHCTHDGPYTLGGKALVIGKQVTIGHHACLHGCAIGNEVLIGIGSIVLDGAVVEDQVMIGAGSLVPPGKKLETGHLYIGSPVKMVRLLKESEKEFLKYSATHYIKLANGHRQETG